MNQTGYLILAISILVALLIIFIVFALILAVIAFIKNRKAELKTNLERQEKIRKAQEAQALAAKVKEENK